VVAILGWRFVDGFLMHLGFKKNIYAEGVIDGKFSVAYPSDGETETVRSNPGNNGPGGRHPCRKRYIDYPFGFGGVFELPANKYQRS
jgi:hypothetical protein